MPSSSRSSNPGIEPRSPTLQAGSLPLSHQGSPINPCTYSQLIYDKGGKNIQWRKDSLFNKCCWENWTAACKRVSLEHSQTPHTKINSKWVEDLNVIPDTIKLLKENIGRTLFDINSSNILFEPPLTVIEIETKVHKWDLIKLKSFCAAKETIRKMKRQTTTGRKYLQMMLIKRD